MKKLLLAAIALCLLCLPGIARADLDFYITDALVNNRYDYHDIVDIQEARGVLPVPNTSTYRCLRVVTAKTKQEVIDLMATGNSGKRRAYFLDRSKMDVASLTYWDTYRVLIDIPEAMAFSWFTRKTGQ